MEKLINRKSSFTLEEIKEELSGNDQASMRELEDQLEESPFLFVSDKADRKEKSHYTPRANIFNGAKFVVEPTKFEIENGILFSGHRFIPFYPDELFPTESFTIKTDAGDPITTKTIKFKLEDLYHYYSLLGAENIIDNIIADHHENQKIITNQQKEVYVTVFDFKKVYLNKTFSAANSLMFTVEDWNKGTFSVAVNTRIPSEETKNEWQETLEKNLYKVFEKKGAHLEIPEQLALAYFYAKSDTLKNAPCPIDKFIRESSKIQIKFYENNTILWYSDKEEDVANPPADISISLGATESLDKILEELKLKIRSPEIKRLIKDTLKSKAPSISPIINKIFQEAGSITFKDKAQEATFYNHLEELWESIANH